MGFRAPDLCLTASRSSLGSRWLRVAGRRFVGGNIRVRLERVERLDPR